MPRQALRRASSARSRSGPVLPVSSFWSGAAVLAAMIALYGWLQSDPSFLDPDSFYHAKMASLIAEHGIVEPFPWLPFTTLADFFADHHLLYHLLLVPFALVLGPLAGTKAAAALFAAAAITVFYALLNVFKVRAPALFALALGTCGGFVLRLNLAKASSLSLALVFGSIILMRKGRALPLFALSWIFVWLYGGWPVLLLVGAVFLGVGLVPGLRGTPGREPVEGGALRHGSWLDRWNRTAGRLAPEIRCALAIPLGLAAGLIVNPYFPRNVRFYWEQIVQIAVVGYAGRIEVGSEWYPYPPARLVVELGPIFILLFLALLVLLPMALSQKDRRPLFGPELPLLVPSFLLAALFLAMTLRSRRHVEYFSPFAMLFDALLVSALLRRIDVRETWDRARAALGKMSFVLPLVGGYLALLFLFFSARDVLAVRAAYREGIPWSRFAKACAWLTANTPEESIVFHSDFNEFPVLFFHDTRNRYIIGLDPTFLYRKDPAKYRRWVEITSGREEGTGTTGASEVIERDFDSRTVLISREHEAMKRLVEKDGSLKLAYQDAETWIYQSLPGGSAPGP